MALYAIGDLHGCARTYDALVDAMASALGWLSPDDTVVFLGDYVDRGPDSPGVLDRMIAAETASADGSGPTCVFLRGNHDQMMLDYADGVGDTELWWANGGQSTLAGYRAAGHMSIPTEHVDFLRRTALAHVQDGFAFVHAGLEPHLSVAANLDRLDPEVLMWTRRHWHEPLDAWELTVVCGHTPVTEPVDQPRLIGIDTGAVFAGRAGLGRLTAVALPERRFVQVDYVG